MSDYPILMRCANCLLNEHPDCPMTHYEYYEYCDYPESELVSKNNDDDFCSRFQLSTIKYAYMREKKNDKNPN